MPQQRGQSRHACTLTELPRSIEQINGGTVALRLSQSDAVAPLGGKAAGTQGRTVFLLLFRVLDRGADGVLQGILSLGVLIDQLEHLLHQALDADVPRNREQREPYFIAEGACFLRQLFNVAAQIYDHPGDAGFPALLDDVGVNRMIVHTFCFSITSP